MVGIRWLAAAAHTGPGSVTLWLLAAVFFFVPSALAVAALGRRYPEEGGLYVWTRELYGPWHGFVCGWCYWLANLFYLPNLVLAGLAMAAAALGWEQEGPPILMAALAILWLALLLNVAGLKTGKWLSDLGGAATCLAGAAIVVFGVLAWTRGGPATPLAVLPEWNFDKLNFWSQIAFAFGGLELGAVMGGEIRSPQRNVPRAAWIAGLGIAAFYILGTLAMLVLRTPDRIHPMTGLADAGADAAARLGMPWIGTALAVAILLGVGGQLGAWIGGVARVPFVIGVDRYLPAAFAKLHPRYGTPHVSIFSQGVACTGFVIALQAGENLRVAYQLLVDLGVITYFIPFLYLFAASWRCGHRISAACGMAVVVAAIGLSTVPPPGVSSVWLFELKVIGGCGLLLVLARWCFARYSRTAS